MEYFLKHSTRTGLLEDLRNNGFKWGSYNEDGEFTEHIPSLYEQAIIRPFGTCAVYLEKLPKWIDDVEVKDNDWHVNVSSSEPLEWTVTVLERPNTPFNVFA